MQGTIAWWEWNEPRVLKTGRPPWNRYFASQCALPLVSSADTSRNVSEKPLARPHSIVHMSPISLPFRFGNAASLNSASGA